MGFATILNADVENTRSDKAWSLDAAQGGGVLEGAGILGSANKKEDAELASQLCATMRKPKPFEFKKAAWTNSHVQ